jgi:hypothetical protein
VKGQMVWGCGAWDMEMTWSYVNLLWFYHSLHERAVVTVLRLDLWSSLGAGWAHAIYSGAMTQNGDMLLVMHSRLSAL